MCKYNNDELCTKYNNDELNALNVEKVIIK